MEKKKWIVTIIDNDAYRIKTKKFTGTVEDAKKMLFGLIQEDCNSIDRWSDGTEALSDVEERRTNGEITSLYGFGSYSGIYFENMIHYHAHLEESMEEVKPC